MRNQTARLEALPAWVKTEMREMQDELDRLVDIIAKMSGTAPSSITVPLDGYARYIPEDAGVDIALPGGAAIHISRDRNTVRVEEKTDTATLLVVPQASGVINIGVLQSKQQR